MSGRRAKGCKGAVIAAALVLSLTGTPAAADKFTSADVLEWSGENQTFYFQTSITMAGAIATQTNPKVARCLNDWYFKDVSKRPKRNEQILAAMRQHREYHPSGVILAVLQKACGSFK